VSERQGLLACLESSIFSKGCASFSHGEGGGKVSKRLTGDPKGLEQGCQFLSLAAVGCAKHKNWRNGHSQGSSRIRMNLQKPARSITLPPADR
jgi:hypothetical protein